MKKIIIFLIKLYQKTLSPDHGPFKPYFHNLGTCRFRPTCSEYAIAAIEKYGVFQGCLMASKRVLRCNPFNPGGWDPVK